MNDAELDALTARLRNAAEHRLLMAQPRSGIRDQASAELMAAAADAIAGLRLGKYPAIPSLCLSADAAGPRRHLHLLCSRELGHAGDHGNEFYEWPPRA